MHVASRTRTQLIPSHLRHDDDALKRRDHRTYPHVGVATAKSFMSPLNATARCKIKMHPKPQKVASQ